MRLLKRSPNGDQELVSVDDNNLPPYAILSHTWTDDEEVTYDELMAGTGKRKQGYAKIRFCGERAAQDGLQYFWVDTCCINKSTIQELQTAINSMFRWYQGASKCYVYLSDVQVPAEVINAQDFRITWVEAFRRSRWFTRGWTLQELLAPAHVEFFSKEGKRLGSRISLEQEIHKTTGVPVSALRGQKALSKFSVEERMSWAAKRTTTFVEDKVYCLLGIFDIFLPLIYGEGEAYATDRLRAEIRRRQVGQGTVSQQDLTVSSLLPFPRNESFVGREDQLQSLEQFFLPNTHRRMTLYGLGGCGKSALALEFAYRMLAQGAGRLVFWVAAISRESFELAYRKIGIHLCIPGITDDNADIKGIVNKALSSDSIGQWLMIVDNADDPSVLMSSTAGDPGSVRLLDYLPHSSRGKILFTTRNRKAAADLTQSSVLELKDMSQVEARQLLARQISKDELLSDEESIDKLLELLAYLPLAIVQAAAFINSNDTPVSDYILLFRNTATETELFGEQFEDPSRYQETESTIAKTWHISFEQIRRQDRLAAEYLSFIACIDRINIPQSLLPPAGSRLQQIKAIGTLKGYAFITERQQPLQKVESEKLFDMHRLVHLSSEWWLKGHDEQTARTAEAAARLEELIPYGGHEGKDVWTRYLSHALHVAGPNGILEEMARAPLLDRIGRCQSSLGQYSAAETTYRRVVLLREKSLGKEHDQTLASMSQVASALESQGKYEEAESMDRQTLARRDKVLGVEHPDTLTSMSNLALGKYSEAESMNRQTLARYEKVLGADHPHTLMSIYCLAHLLANQRRTDESVVLYERACTGYSAVLGEDHPTTRACRNHYFEVLMSLK
ncbi:kinesin light chain 1 [Aulographum hederae CBS 113979]|uniref:Kinesin light chain 1 n=1 Tax=Aulographum hederae CBS 113979 TaxID=1176131 RepID=A0A6G1HE55_9PEZI|nr:kinesin light chain 1 [Aulographum hederae CBS 113979]